MNDEPIKQATKCTASLFVFSEASGHFVTFLEGLLERDILGCVGCTF